ncbi:head-tail connector protein [Leuconostoc gelidum subsp. gelidum]|uniref:Head-tail connector protein n=1 Tax=Leuconostoc gelidum subsp. gelidum TaxID=1607839 RepID=A0ABS7V0X9_LEUGE|nr:head-tail connector protein [Leuconostoc gelidum]MBZ5977366.1 head-tail connector protein [Leuconostoc gelidum subsp. gelidum]MBZ5999019.1 head-tail connector protein [Leuconostoc gelidum subsp. gelidum]
MALVTSQELADELNIDTDDAELKTVDSLIDSAKAMIQSSIKLKITDADILAVNEPLYNRLIKTMATSLYYDRELSTGYSKGVMIMLTNLRAEVLGVYNA